MLTLQGLVLPLHFLLLGLEDRELALVLLDELLDGIALLVIDGGR